MVSCLYRLILSADATDNTRYQTVFHDPKIASVTAPTASLHLMKGTLAMLRDKGINTSLILHVGAGTCTQ
jgi:S-adenosylmethionine:tRNA ribosyltransferase-isomerase